MALDRKLLIKSWVKKHLFGQDPKQISKSLRIEIFKTYKGYLNLLKNTLRKIYDYQKNFRIYKKYINYTMIPVNLYLSNLEICQNFQEIQGAIVECGVWRGGMMGGMAEIFGSKRNYYLFDSFEGLPEVKEIDGKQAQEWQSNTSSPTYFDNCKAEIDFARQAMQLSPAENTQIIKGWFSETLKDLDLDLKEGIAILRLDGDWYESTMDCLKFLYPKVNTGGVIIIDDYYKWDGCARAVHDYLSRHNLPIRIQQDISGVCYIVKSIK